MITALKFIHIGAIAIWAGGLAALPAMFRRREGLEGATLDRLHRGTRFVYLMVISPAAIAAIASGIALMFLRETFVPWFSAKMYFVAALAGLHVLAGRMVLNVFHEDQHYPVWRATLSMAATAAVAGCILYLVLAKPHIALALPEAVRAPGGLSELIPFLPDPPRAP